MVAKIELDTQPDWSVRYARLAGYAIYAVTILTGLMVGAVRSDGTALLGTIAVVWSMSFFVRWTRVPMAWSSCSRFGGSVPLAGRSRFCVISYACAGSAAR
jgi:hypothetical protein